MRELIQRIPDVDVFLAVEPEELARLLLLGLNERQNTKGGQQLHCGNLSGELCRREGGAYPIERQAEVIQAFYEAWAYLENTGLLIPAEGMNGQNGWRRLSRRALQAIKEDEGRKFQARLQFPRHLVHPRIVEAVWPLFMRGSYPAAVFEAMREVEIATREAGGFDQKDHGVPLMRTAFNKENGPLADRAMPEGEREAVANLFAGAIGLYKNPHSHRHVELADPLEAMEMIMLASLLLRIVDVRGPERQHHGG